MDIDFRVVLKEVDESYPEGLLPEEVAVYIAEKKVRAFDGSAGEAIVLTADTIVCVDDMILGKPSSSENAVEMLSLLSGRMHRVITGVCLMQGQKVDKFYDISEVFFREMSEAEIRKYVENYKPMDKAGAYGIQEWIGVTGIVKINGSYTNVVGLPTEKVFQHLVKMV